MAENQKTQKNGKKKVVKLRFNLWKIGLTAITILFFAPLFIGIFQERIDSNQVELSQAVLDIKDKKIEKVVVQDDKLLLEYKDGQKKVTTKEDNISFPELMDRSGISLSEVKYATSDQSFLRAFADIMGTILPIALMAVLLYFFLRAQNKGAADIFSFGKSRAKIFAKGKQDVKFEDVAGVDEAKKELTEIVDFLKNPAKYRKIGARTPKGVLLFGPSGTGKTLLSRAVAGEANVPFFSMAGSEFMEVLVGIGASRVRDLFGQAKAAAPSIIFIDEIDAIGRQRGGRGFVGGHDEREQTLNQILVEMDGFTPNDQVIILAATNRGDVLDPALLRPGRFDRRVVLDMPDKEGRESIIKIHAKGKKFSEEVDWERIANRTVGFSGADLENMLNEAAIAAARHDKEAVEMDDIEEAATKVKLGPARKRLQSKEDKSITAYHEGGHAVVTHFLSKMDPVHRISIVARGMSLGHTLIPPAADRAHETRDRFIQQLTAMLGGRAAEEVIFNEMTSGASNDIETATRLARAMVEEYGMSSLGPVNWGPQIGYGEFGQVNYMEPAAISPTMQEKVDLEVKRIMDDAHRRALIIVRKNKKLLDKVSEALLEKETIDRDEFEKIVGKKV